MKTAPTACKRVCVS